MSDKILEIQRQHGEKMYRLGLKHSLEMAKTYHNHGGSLDDLIKHLEDKLVKESIEHSRFDEEHRKVCDSCRDAYEDFLREEEFEQEYQGVDRGGADFTQD